jgi:hypothetical protein
MGIGTAARALIFHVTMKSRKAMNNDFTPRKAEKKKVKLKMAVQGPSGSGKTLGALSLARHLWPESKICVVDTENESASLYADKFGFDTIPLGPPFTTARYVQCIDAVVKGGYDVLIIDTITAQWDGPGGILERKNQMDLRGGNGYANWVSFTPEHEAFKQAILQAPLHVIATMRSKQDYILQANDKGKQMPIKVGMAPIQRDQIDYEFTVVFDVQMDHKAVASKDRTGLFKDTVVDLTDTRVAESIAAWLNSGIDVAPPAQNRDAVKSDPIKETKADPQQEPFAFVTGTTLTCTPISIDDKTSANGPYVKVIFKGNVMLEGNEVGTSETNCFDKKLFDAIKLGTNQECQFRVKQKAVNGKQRINIEDVLYIGPQYYEFGQPAQVGTVKENPDAEPA